jgi:DNA-binding beta-propeller fold protein YncE
MRESGLGPLAAACRSCAPLRAIVMLAVCLGCLASVGSAAAAVGDLTPVGCIGNSGTGPPSCIGTVGLDGASSVAVSRDGQNVYATGFNSQALVVFGRAANGDLTPAGCIGNSGTGPPSCIGTVGLDGASSVAVSPDGQNVYATGFNSQALVVFGRAANGDLTPAGCIGNSGTGPPSCIGTDGLDGANSVAVSPDGQSVYVASPSSGALVVFRRAANGDLTPAGCIGNSGTGPPSCIGTVGLGGVNSVAVSPDGQNVYATGFDSEALVVFGRAANGDLTPAGCIGNSGTGPPSCIGTDGLYGATSVAVSPDGKSVYVASANSGALVVFRRAANGDLTPAGCIGNSGTGPPSCIGTVGLGGARSVAVSPDGANVYVASATSEALVVFQRAANGDLTPAGCIGNSANLPDPGPPSCIGTDGLDGANSVAVSPDGESVYVASSNSDALVVFRRATSPGGGGGGTGGGGSGGTGGGGSPPATTVTGLIGNRKVTLATTVPSGCLATSATLNASLSAAAIAGSSGSALSFVRASFYIDRGVKHVHHHVRRHNGKKVTVTTVTHTANRTVTSVPAKVSLKLGGLKSGSHTLRVRVVFHKSVRRNGHKRTVSVFKTLSQKFTVCGTGGK